MGSSLHIILVNEGHIKQSDFQDERTYSKDPYIKCADADTAGSQGYISLTLSLLRVDLNVLWLKYISNVLRYAGRRSSRYFILMQYMLLNA